MPAASGAAKKLKAEDVTHYEVLGLPVPSRSPSSIPPSVQDVKAAYRRALLVHHPDKAPSSAGHVNMPERSKAASSPLVAPKYTVDAIREAYHTLSTPSLREEYDRMILSKRRGEPSSIYAAAQTTELHELDLGDMHYDARKQEYYEACRCGHRRGFSITEDELTEIDGTEVLLECPDCSHHVRVCFEVEDEEEEQKVQASRSSGATVWNGEGIKAGMQWQASVAMDAKCVVS